MARRAIPLSEQIDRQEAIVIAMKKKYDASVEKLEKLVTKQRELESKEILEHLKTTSRSFNEIIAFLDGNDLDENKDLNWYDKNVCFTIFDLKSGLEG